MSMANIGNLGFGGACIVYESRQLASQRTVGGFMPFSLKRFLIPCATESSPLL
jgi:hypothetical protein